MSSGPAASDQPPAHPKYKVTLASLVTTQALSNTSMSMMVLIAALTGAYLADDPRLSTVPIACTFIGTMAMIIPASLIMRRIGRRAGFTLGQAIGCCAALIQMASVLSGSFIGFAAGCALLGVHNAFWQYLRFAAADISTPETRSRAISYVMAGGVFSALVAPELAKATQDLFAPILFAGCYAAIAVLCLISAAVLQATHLPAARDTGASGQGRPLAEIMRQPVFIAAAASAMIGYGAMSLVMTATPLEIVACGLTFNDAAFVIQWHVLAMFGPSFVTGHIINRFGVLKVITVGIALNFGAMAANMSGDSVMHFWTGLVMLGLGWNFMYVGGTTLLTDAYRPEEREKTQAANDFLVFTTITVASLSSGAVHAALGWSAVNLAIVAPLVAVAALLVWFGWMRRAQA